MSEITWLFSKTACHIPLTFISEIRSATAQLVICYSLVFGFINNNDPVRSLFRSVVVGRVFDRRSYESAHRVGCTLIDCHTLRNIACSRNEADVGRGIKKSGLRREDVFVVSKVFNNNHGYELTTKTVHESLAKWVTLNMSYVPYKVSYPQYELHSVHTELRWIQVSLNTNWVNYTQYKIYSIK